MAWLWPVSAGPAYDAVSASCGRAESLFAYVSALGAPFVDGKPCVGVGRLRMHPGYMIPDSTAFRYMAVFSGQARAAIDM